MQHDIQPSQVTCVFCWRTSTGEVASGARDAAFNGRPVAYRPEQVPEGAGLHTSVNGRICGHPPIGASLNAQGCIGRMSAFLWGYVMHAHLVPARDARELEILRDAARRAIVSGDAREWALAAIHAGDREWLAIHVAAPASIVASFARRVGAPWTVTAEEKSGRNWPKGAKLCFYDREGAPLETLIGDILFQEAPLPPLAAFDRESAAPQAASTRDRRLEEPVKKRPGGSVPSAG